MKFIIWTSHIIQYTFIHFVEFTIENCEKLETISRIRFEPYHITIETNRSRCEVVNISPRNCNFTNNNDKCADSDGRKMLKE